MTKEADWERLADPQMISARNMVMLAVFIEIIVQTFALIVQPTAWWTWQLLGFITATNLAAVILAIMAQKTANDIGASTKLAFTPSFYKTMTLLSKFQEYFEEEAAKGGRDMNEEMEDIAPKMYGLVRKYLDNKALEAQVMPPDVAVLPADESLEDDALFRNA
tara:strand:+ start:114 stop:602 length:489 start_codon:yes stop_codon:yes gene_type:complete